MRKRGAHDREIVSRYFHRALTGVEVDGFERIAEDAIAAAEKVSNATKYGS